MSEPTVLDGATAASTPSIIDSIVDAWATKDETVTIEVPVAGGNTATMKFKVMLDRADLMAATGRAKRFAEGAKQRYQGKPDAEVYDTNDKTLVQAHLLAECNLDGIKVAEFLKLAKKAGPMFDLIVAQYDQSVLGSIRYTEKEGVDEAKKELPETSTTETGS